VRIQSRLKGAAAPVALSIALFAQPAFAQDGETLEAAEDTTTFADAGELIIVTGSRILRPEFSFPNPVASFSDVTIEQSGKTNLTDFLVNSPALLGSMTNIDVAGSNLPNSQLVGVNMLDLRNLGVDRTLVLVDGRRHVAGYPGTAAVDINTIPTDLVERVDVLTGGASAIYGADGVSGVVNFILKRDFEGLNLRGQVFTSERGDAGSRFFAATAGKNFADGRGNITIAYEFNENDQFSQRQRLNYGRTGPSWAFARNIDDYFDDDPNVPDRILYTDLRWADSSMGGAIDLDGDFVPDFTGEGGIYDLGTYIPGSAFTIGGSSTPRESYFGDFTPYTRRHIANVMASFEVTPDLKLFAEGKYVRSKARTLSQPSYDFYTTLFSDNAYLAERFGPDAAPDGATITRDHFDLGIRESEMERELYRFVVGAEAEITPNLRFDFSYVYGQSTSTSIGRNERIADRYYAALDAVIDPDTGNITCRINLPGETEVRADSYNSILFTGAPVTFQPGQCIPLNLLGEGTPQQHQSALDWIMTDTNDWARIRQHVLSAVFSGDTGSFLNLQGGPIGFALGAEYRKEESHFIPSDQNQAGILMDSAPARIDQGTFNVKELFAEVNLPILSGVPLAENLSIGGAFRLSDYSTIGTTKTWNVNGSYSPIRDITFRGTYSEAVRAPNISELFAGGSGTYEFIVDPCGVDRLAEGTQYREANCRAALEALGFDLDTFNPADDFTSPQNSSLLGFQGGNSQLDEETAKTWTAGVVLRPSFIPGLTMSFDWYDIRLKQAINYATAQDIVDLCYDSPSLDNVFCVEGDVRRAARNGFIDYYSVIPQNVASYETAGLDVVLSYRFEPFDNFGTFDLRLSGNYLDKLQFVPSAGAELENELDMPSYPAPRYSATFDLTWTNGPLALNYGIEYWSKTRRATREQEAANPDYFPAEYIWYKERWEHSLYASYEFAERFKIYAGVNNLFDTKPDIGAVAYPISAVGRAFFVGANVKAF